MKLSIELLEAESDGKGKMTVSYQIGSSQHTQTREVGLSGLMLFHNCMREIHEFIFGGAKWQIENAVETLHKYIGSPKDKE